MILYPILTLLILVLIVLITPFTPVGNALLKPFIQSKIDEFSPLPLELSHFQLGFSSFDIRIKGKEALSAQLVGSYSLWSQSIDALLNINAKDLAYASKITQIPLKGAFTLQTKATGNRELLSIIGESNIAHSQTKFLAELRAFAFSSAIIAIKQAQLDAILNMIGKPVYAKAALDLDLKINSDGAGGFVGESEFNVKNGAVAKKLIERDFGVAIPAMSFETRLLGKFNSKGLAHNLQFNSNIGQITSTGITDIEKLTTDSNYMVALSELAPLAPITKIPLRGKFETKGTLKGGKEVLNIEGTTDLADSRSSYSAALKNLAPDFVHVDIKSLKLEKLLYMLYKPPYIAGVLNLNAALKEFDKGITGEALLEIPSALTDLASIQRDFNLALPATKFSLTSDLHLKQGSGVIKTLFSSPLATLSAPNTTLALKPSLGVNLPYELTIPDLSKLAFVTKQKLQGDLKASGTLKYDNNGIFADFLSNTLKGKVQGNLKNSDLALSAKGIEFSELLKMLNYPVVFTSKADGALNYNLESKKGTLHFNATQGRFLENQLSRMLHPFFKIDLAKEVYDQVALESKINGGKIHSDLLMKSPNTEIKSKNALIDLDEGKIDSILDVAIKNNQTAIKIKGALTAPKISVDTKGLIKEKIKEKAKEKAKEAIEKHLPENIKDPVEKLLKGIF